MLITKSENKMKKENYPYVISAALALMLIASFFYFNGKIAEAQRDYNSKIKSTEEQVKQGLDSLRQSLDANFKNLSAEINVADANLESFKSQNEQEIKTLNEIIDEIERQSNIQLGELKSELKDIKIKSADFSAIVDDVLNSVVSISTDKAQGSGVIVDSRGYIVTNVHVISGATSVKVAMHSGKTYDVNILAGYDGNADIAVLKIDNVNLPALSFGDSGKLKVGEKVIAAGNPAGLSFTITEGIVSQLRKIENKDYVQTDVPINPGNSGGPLVNSKAEIVGINNFKVGGFEGLGFAIASNHVKEIVDGIIQSYEAQHNQ